MRGSLTCPASLHRQYRPAVIIPLSIYYFSSATRFFCSPSVILERRRVKSDEGAHWDQSGSWAFSSPNVLFMKCRPIFIFTFSQLRYLRWGPANTLSVCCCPTRRRRDPGGRGIWKKTSAKDRVTGAPGNGNLGESNYYTVYLKHAQAWRDGDGGRSTFQTTVGSKIQLLDKVLQDS